MAAPAHKTLSIDLGLSVLCAVKCGDEWLTGADIAEVCECTNQLICEIERIALQKLKAKIELENHRLGDYR